MNFAYFCGNTFAEVFLEWEIFRTKFVETKRTLYVQKSPPPPFLDNSAVYGHVQTFVLYRQATNGDKIRRRRYAMFIKDN